jgi:dipeptidyl-peptidase-4
MRSPARLRRSRVALAAYAFAVVTQATARAADPLPLDVIFSEEGHARAPSELAWTEDGRRVSFLWSKEGKRDLWAVTLGDDDGEPGASEPNVLLRAGELRDGERELPYKEYAWSPDGGALLLQHEGQLYLYRLASKKIERLTRSEQKNEDPRFAPDSKSIAFVRAADLWTIDLATGQERRLTHDGEERRILNGKPDWVYWEEIWGRRSIGFWWSPDSRRIAYLRFEEEGVPTHPLIDDKERDPRVEQQPYPKAGDRNPTVKVGVLDLDSGATTWMETGARDGEDYLARVRFTPRGDRLGVIRIDRDQTEAALLSCDPRSGACETVLVDRRAAWVDVGDDFALLEDGRVLWGSDRDGWWRLWLYGADGEIVRAVSPEGILVIKLVRVVESTGQVYFTGCRTGELGAKDRQVYRVSLAGGDTEVLSAETAGSTTVDVAPEGQAWVLTHSSASTPPRSTLVEARRTPTATALPFQAATAYDRSSLPRGDFLAIPGPDGAALPARILKPPGFDPGRRHPVIMFHYGGPASQVVEDASNERPSRDLWHVRQAQRGYIVVMSDNPASTFFGKTGAERLHRRFGELELRSQLAVVDYLKAQPWVDADRIGLWGWSGGGANTLYSVLRSPGVWSAAVAGAPVTDWRLYDSIWTERYLDHPDDNEDGYRDSSAVTWASALQDPLLIVHGTADDNVHPHNTLAMTRALVKAGKQFEQAIYPGEKHAFGDAANRHFFERMERFFDRWLRDRASAAE